MNTLHQQIKDGIKNAMKNREEIRLLVLRGLLADFTNELVAKGIKPQEILDDDDALAVIRRAAKRRKDSIEQFGSGGREDLVMAEEAELKIIETFIPAAMPEDEIKKVVLAKKSELDIADKTKLGLLMSAVMKELKGKADGALVKKIVEESLG